MRSLAGCILAAALVLAGPDGGHAAAPVEIDAKPLDVAAIAGPRRRIGELDLLAGFHLTSRDERFGGLSGLLGDGDRLMAVSDRGTFWSARLDRADDGTLLGLRDWTVENVGVAYDDWPPDLEAVARLADGTIVASAETPSRGLTLFGTPPAWLPGMRDELAEQPPNEGVEAMTTLADGTLMTFGEAEVEGGLHEVVLFGADGVRHLRYATESGFAPTDADRVGSNLLVLERRLSLLGGFEARIVLVDLAATPPEAGTTLRGRELARLGVGSISDNFEGLAAERARDGRLVIYVVSDDNFLPVQRTLLLQFRSDPLP
ncbi:MAG: esterase-like activity of phytase family protein [Geminicoccaceae bacterium]